MRNYEVTFIVDPVLSGEEIKATAQAYGDLLQQAGNKIVHVDEMGLRTLAYSINKRNSGVYYSIEVTAENGEFIDDVELAMRRDERIMRFLTVRLDKFGVKYNEDKRNGLIGKAKRKDKKSDDKGRDRDRGRSRSKPAPKPAAKPAPKPEPKPEPKPAPAPVEAKKEEEE